MNTLLPDLTDFITDHRPYGALTATEPAWNGH